jgi:hypothetical protein
MKLYVFDKPAGGNKIGTIEANVEITATENINQWLHLVEGGWVSAGARQQYIKWQVVPGSVDPTPPPSESGKTIKGKTLIKRDVFDKPQGTKKIGTLEPDTIIFATENIFQWLHLVDGGWVNAGLRQQYIKWSVVSDPIVPPPIPDPVVTPPPPVDPWIITEIKREGRIATLLVDWQNPKFGFAPRNVLRMAYPQTVTFNTICADGKGSTIPLTSQMEEYLCILNGQKTKELILTTGSGWVNIATPRGTVERLSWAANHVIVKETRVEKDVEFSNIYAPSCYATDLIGTFFDKDMRLIIHKFNAITKTGNMIKLTNKRDCYTPLMTTPDEDNGDMWIRSEYLEMWPELPFTLSDGTQIIEYELFGFMIYGKRADGKSILLRDPQGFKTNWKINSPELPV